MSMKKFVWYTAGAVLLATALTTTACSTLKNGVATAMMDTTVRPGDDFFRYANGAWLEKTEIPADKASFSVTTELIDRTDAQLNGIIQDLAKNPQKPGSDGQRIADLYAVYMDEARRDKEGAEPIKADLAAIAAIKDRSELPAFLGRISRDGRQPFFGQWIGPDSKNPTRRIFTIWPGGFGLPQEFFKTDDERSHAALNGYHDALVKLFTLAGWDAAGALAAADADMQVETTLVKPLWPRAKLREPEATYHKMTRADLARIAPHFDWNAYFTAAGLDHVQTLIVGQEEPITAMDELLATAPLDEIKARIATELLTSAALRLGKQFSDAWFDFTKTLSGVEAMPPLWRRAVSVVDNTVPDALGKLYVKRYFPESSKKAMLTMERELQATFADRIKNLDWMSPATKAAALEKLAAVRVRIGYPDKWHSYDGMVIDKSKSLYENDLSISRWYVARDIRLLDEPVDPALWEDITPQTVNAFYMWTDNSVNFPAAFLQPPFFDPEADAATNYGAIGAVIGHEMTHGFDTTGCHFDKTGALREWWQSDDEAKFDAKADAFAAYFDTIQPVPDMHVNGKLTQGENIADFGGLEIAWQTWKRISAGKDDGEIAGLTGPQRFFISYAQSWAERIRDEALRMLIQTDEHAPPEVRVNAVVPNMPQWYAAFAVKPGDKMFIPPEKRLASIW
jgi:putative endopeptidase